MLILNELLELVPREINMTSNMAWSVGAIEQLDRGLELLQRVEIQLLGTRRVIVFHSIFPGNG